MTRPPHGNNFTYIDSHDLEVFTEQKQKPALHTFAPILHIFTLHQCSKFECFEVYCLLYGIIR